MSETNSNIVLASDSSGLCLPPLSMLHLPVFKGKLDEIEKTVKNIGRKYVYPYCPVVLGMRILMILPKHGEKER